MELHRGQERGSRATNKGGIAVHFPRYNFLNLR
jgi:hypothetical protein